MSSLDARQEGLESAEARRRRINYRANLLKPPKRSDTVTLLLAQFKSPILLTLIFAAGLSFFLQDHVDGAIILFIVLVSGLLGFWRERGAVDAVEKLLSIVRIKTTALSDGSPNDIPIEDVVPGDVVILNAGDAIPADCLILESKDLFVDEATLTGESCPAEKETVNYRRKRH
ncbi:MAG: HAD-IC family P-type ATPase [Syntrophales bacterium]